MNEIHIVSICGGKWGIVGALIGPIPDPNRPACQALKPAAKGIREKQ